jgi:circadian clock protein KaiC
MKKKTPPAKASPGMHGAMRSAAARDPDKVVIRKLPTGIPGLDAIMGGGLPEFSFNILAGGPGCGKTTFAHQFIFANATPQRPALYFTILGEPSVKMLRYQQQYTFFNASKLNSAIRFVNLSHVVLEKNFGAVLEAIVKEVESAKPAFVVVDSFRTALRKREDVNEMEVQFFVQQLGLHLTSWEATTFLIGEYHESEIKENPIFTVADGLIWLSQAVERNSVVRKLQVMKLRGQGSVPGLHTFRIADDGLRTFSRTLGLEQRVPRPEKRPRLSTGIAGMDKLMGGGIPRGDIVLIAGASGTGKTAFASHFIAEGLRRGEPGIMVVFEEQPEDVKRRAKNIGHDLAKWERTGELKILYLRPLDLSVDESLQTILDAVKKIDAKRLVIDSLIGFQLALAPGFRTDFRESIYRMLASMSGAGVTVLSTAELHESFMEFRFSQEEISLLADDIIRLRYVEIDGVLRRIATIVKMRDSQHSKEIREYEITKNGMVLTNRPLNEYRGLITGVPSFWKAAPVKPPE